jgi:hypothetical protein
MPTIRSYTQATQAQTDDAFVLDRIGVGTMYIETADLIPQNSNSFNLGFEFLGTSPPISNQLIGAVSFPINATFPINFAGSVGGIVTNPTSSFVMPVKQNGTQVGTITVSTSGVYTFATTSSTGLTISINDKLTVYGPATADSTAAGIFFTLAGSQT